MGLIDFGLLVVVDLILVVLWLVACDSFGLWACLWWWWFLVVVEGGHEREREICGVDDFVLILFGFMFKICGAIECVVRNCLYFG